MTTRPLACRPLLRRAIVIVGYFICGYTLWNIYFTLNSALIYVRATNSAAPESDAFQDGISNRITEAMSAAAAAAADAVAGPSSRPICVPKILHITWFYPNETAFRFHQAISLLSAQRFFHPEKIYFWHDTVPTGPWWIFIRQSVAHLLLIPYRRPRHVFGQAVTVPEHQSDVARLRLLQEHGGLYIDLDVVLVRPLAPLLCLDKEVVLGAETPDMLGSGFIIARHNASFLRLWSQSYVRFNDQEWNYHSVYVPMRLARRHPDLVRVEWFTINRPNWHERSWLFTEGKLWDWSENFAVHLWYREHNVEYNPITIRTLNTTLGEIFRYIYYENSRLLPPVVTEDH